MKADLDSSLSLPPGSFLVVLAGLLEGVFTTKDTKSTKFG
jgi:hypothetical protein